MFLNALRPLAFAGLVVVAASTAALAERRVALVIGNSAYQNVSKLANPANDSAAITALLKTAGFDVVESQRDLGIANMRRVIRDFVDNTRDADIAVVYYAGHGIEVDGANYLIPVDAALNRDIDVEDEALPLDRVLKVLEPAKRLRLVILDACRDNPFAKTMKRTISSRAIGRGLAKVDVMASDTLIAFAAKAGSTASDGDSRNSPFTVALVKHLATPGLDLRLALGQVRDDVLKATQSRQEPFVYGSLGGAMVSLVPPKPVAAPPAMTQTPPAAVVDQAAAARRDYEFAERVNTKEVWDSFLSVHSSGLYAELARAQRSKLVAAEQVKAAQDAKSAEDAKTAERSRAAEQLRAAERAKADDQAKAQAKALEEAKAAEKRATELAKVLEKKLADEQIKAAQGRSTVVASAPTATPEATAPASAAGPAPGETARLLQSELRRVGCFNAAADGDWNAASRKAVETFNRYSGMRLDAKAASIDTLDAVKQRQSRICPVECGKGFRPDGERCTKIACSPGTTLNDEGTGCERIRERAASRPVRDTQPAAPAKPAGGGQVACGKNGCVEIKPNCQITSHNRSGTMGIGNETVVCR
jgi:uncharacterized caspase-like protein